MSDIVNKLPAQMRNMMGYDESMFNGINEEEMESPAYIRRMALQDLYRFYQLHNDKACMVNPFDDTRALFVTNVTFLYTNLKKIYNDLCLFMHQQNKTKELETILLNHIDMSDVKCMMMHATLAMKIQDPWKALPYLQRAILLEPDNRKVLKMLGKVYFAMDEYEDADVADEFAETVAGIQKSIDDLKADLLSRYNGMILTQESTVNTSGIISRITKLLSDATAAQKAYEANEEQFKTDCSIIDGVKDKMAEVQKKIDGYDASVAEAVADDIAAVMTAIEKLTAAAESSHDDGTSVNDAKALLVQADNVA